MASGITSVLLFSHLGVKSFPCVKKEVNEEVSGPSRLTMQVVNRVRSLFDKGECIPETAFPRAGTS